MKRRSSIQNPKLDDNRMVKMFNQGKCQYHHKMIEKIQFRPFTNWTTSE